MFALHSLAGLALVVAGLPLLSASLDRLGVGPPRLTAARLRYGVAVQWLGAAVVAAYALAVETESLASVGVVLDSGVFGEILVAWLVAAGLYALTAVLVNLGDPTLLDDAAVLLYAQPTRWKVAIAVTAGITEEFLYRGYLIERALDIGVPPLAAGLLSAGAFLLAHLPGRDTRAVLGSLGPVSIGFVLAYFLTRSVPALAVAHASIDLLALLSTDTDDVLDRIDPEQLDERVRRALGGN